MKKFEKALDAAVIIVALIVAIYVGKNIGLEYLFRGNETPVTAQTAQTGYYEDYIGLPAGDDIIRIQNLDEWEKLLSVELATVEPENIISTGLGSRHNWVSSSRRNSRTRTTAGRSDLKKTAFDIFNEYGEYYLIQIPDGSYILAQLPMEDARSLKQGKTITLPIGSKKGLTNSARARLEEICTEYNVSLDGVFYCINDNWNEKHSFMMLVSRFAVGALVLFSLGTVLIIVLHKIFKLD